MTTSPISAFHMDGPWLSPEFGPPPQNVSPTSLSANSLAMKFRDSELPDEFVVALIEAILRWSNSGFDGLSQQNRQCVLYTLGLFPQPGPGLINNVTGPRIRNIMLPVLVLDHLLHGAQPASTAVLKHRNPNRPPSHYKHNHHFQRYNKWHEVLTKAAKLHEEGKRIKSKADQASEFAEEGGVRQEAIESLSTLNNLSVPGDVAVYNITQAAFMLRAIQKGVMELTEENIVDLAWSQARETDPTIPRHEVKAAVSNPNLQGIPAALAVAVAASPIYLLSGQNYAQSIYNPGTSIYHMWLSSGNSHIVNLEHPLGKLDRLFWQLLPKVSCGMLSPRLAVTQLFASTEMKLALEGKHTPEILGALIHYISDEKMETINEPEDLETERQMAQFLELTRKQVQEQEARLEEEKRKGEEEEKRKAEELLQLPEQPATPNKDNEDPANATKADESGKEEKRKAAEEEKRKAEELLQLPEQPATPNKDNEDPANATKADESGKEEKRKAAEEEKRKAEELLQLPEQPATPNKDNEDPANATKADESGKDDKKEDDKKDEPKKRKGKVPPEPSTRELRSSKKNPADKTETVAATVAPAARSKSKKPSSNAKTIENGKTGFINVDNRVRYTEPEQQSLQRGRFFTWNASRPLHPNVMDLVLYAPGSIAGDFVDTSFQYTMFQKFESDREMLKAMFASQPKDAKNMPTFLDNSARNPNPKLQASATQSIFFVCTEKEYSALTPSMKHQIHRHRCVILVDVYMQDPSPPFNRETMQEFRDPDALCSLQDMGLEGQDGDNCVVGGPLSALLPQPNRPVLNAVHHPLPHHRLPTPPGLSTFCSLSPSLTFLEGHKSLPIVHSPWGDRQWALWATAMARTAIHQDIAATEMTVITGSKMIAIGCPRTENFDATKYRADHGSRYIFLDWEKVQETGGTDLYRWEIFLLRPNMAFYMPAGTPHFVISLEDTIAHGLHSINAAQIQPTVFNVLHNFITEGAFANAEHHPIQLLLIRMFIYWVEILMRNPPLSTIHSPNIHTGEGLLDLLTLYSYVILYPALLLDTYPLMKPTQAVFGTASVMSAEQYQEYKLALHHAVVLNRWMDMKFVIGETNTTSKRMLVHQATRTFDWLCDVSIVHMAGCLAQYRADWLARKRQVTANFTTTTLKQQLRRTLCAYYSAWENNWHTLGDSSDFEISLEVNVLCERFDRRVQDLTYTHFMPWDLLSRGMPYFAKKENHIMAQKKRPALPDEENPRKRPRNDN